MDSADRPKGEDLLVLFPITSRPCPDRFAIEIPEMEKRRAGLGDSVTRLDLFPDVASLIPGDVCCAIC